MRVTRSDSSQQLPEHFAFTDWEHLPGETWTALDSHGDPLYLFVAARISQRQLELAGTAHKLMDDGG